MRLKEEIPDPESRKADDYWSTIRHLRFPFSFFLMPVFLLAVSLSAGYNLTDVLILFIILHGLVYPSSNGFNSLMDRDEGSIGGLEKPPAVPRKLLFYTTLAMDVAAVLASFLLYTPAGWMVLAYILASRAYSYRGIRLKKHPVTGLLTVMFFQGGAVFATTWMTLHNEGLSELFTQVVPLTGMIFSMVLLGAGYPLTQIYQHEQDRRDGVVSLSSTLGYRGTFYFAGILFGTAFLLYALLQYLSAMMWTLPLFLLLTSPATLFFLHWARKVWKDPAYADYQHAMQMNKKGATWFNLYFFILILL